MEDELDEDFGQGIREELVDILELWISKDEQVELLTNRAPSDVYQVLFANWYTFFNPTFDRSVYEFNTKEMELLDEFDNLMLEWQAVEKGERRMPEISEFVDSAEWKQLNSLAQDCLKTIAERK
jgi:hypothetical protein